MKHLIPYLVLVVVAVTFAGQSLADPGQDVAASSAPTTASTTSDATSTPATDPDVEWVLTISKEAAHKFEPFNPIPKAMPRKLAELLVKQTTDRHELAMLVTYSFAEGAFSLDYELPGDCRDTDGVSLPPGSPKCTKKLVEAGKKCCAVEKATHFCTLQIEPKPASLEECVQRGAAIMHKDLTSTCAYPGSIYATGGSCVYNRRIDWRAKIAQKLEKMP